MRQTTDPRYGQGIGGVTATHELIRVLVLQIVATLGLQGLVLDQCSVEMWT